MVKPIKVDWSFKGLTGTFDRASLQRGFQVYKEVCSSCHSMQYLSYRNLGEPGGPEFSEAEVKAIAANFEVQDGPNADGEMFTRPGRPSDKFVSPYPNIQAATAANGGAYPPDMSVLVKSRKGGAEPFARRSTNPSTRCLLYIHSVFIISTYGALYSIEGFLGMLATTHC